MAAVLMCAALVSLAQVRPGIEMLRDSGFDILRGKRVGLITNPTGVDNSLKSTVDILAEAGEVNLVALFAPEHGVRGDVMAGDAVGETTDSRTGLKVYSLYGRTKRPTPAMLSAIDVMVYDIQDNGSRSYTFISTMGEAMDACAKAGVEFVVLDRPDPLGGLKVEGNIRDTDCRSFVSRYAIPYIYGLTCGELARYLAGTSQAGTPDMALTVVRMDGWERDMLFEDTGMPWVLTSPQQPVPQTTLFYPATGIMGELNYVSIGVGYTLPFMTIAAPWIDADDFTEAMNALSLPGLRFRPITYKPYFGLFKGETVGGTQPYITDYELADLTLLQFYAMQELVRLYPSHKPFTADTSRLAMFDKVAGSKQIRAAFSRAYRVEDMLPYWDTDGLRKFKAEKTRYHLYD